jgi:hypothetical protein
MAPGSPFRSPATIAISTLRRWREWSLYARVAANIALRRKFKMSRYLPDPRTHQHWNRIQFSKQWQRHWHGAPVRPIRCGRPFGAGSLSATILKKSAANAE